MRRRKTTKRNHSSDAKASVPQTAAAPSEKQSTKTLAQQANKIFPRNLTAQAKFMVAGNPVVTRPEDAVANCFPGLEVDIRNLDRRFFPGLVFDFIEKGARLAYVDVYEDPDLQRDTIEAKRLYLKLSDDATQKRLSHGSWYLDEIEQNGKRMSMHWQGNPLQDTSAWRVVRSLELGPVTIRLKRRTGRTRTLKLKGWRRRYTDEMTGVINRAYQPGELMQGLCSPWQHDFRDCACFYWAANHPDIVLGEIYPGESLPQAVPDDAAGGAVPAQPVVSDVPLDWQRVDRSRSLSARARATLGDNRPYQIDHFQVNHIWQDLSVVIGGREIGGLYVPETIDTANPYGSPEELATELSTRLGPLEIALTFEYLFARFSLLDESEVKGNGMLRDAIAFARERLLLIAASEMQHLRWVNQMLWDLRQAGIVREYVPVLTPATKVPTSAAVTVDRDFDSVASGQQAQDPKAHRLGTLHRFTAEVRSAGVGGMHRADNFRPVELRALTPETLQDFIAVEHPSAYIDSAYSRVVATLVQKREQRYPEFTGELAQRIAADGVQHETRFREIKDALSPFFGDLSYLRKKFREGEKQEAEAAAGPLRIIKNSLRSAYAAANENQFSRSAREIADARAAMNDLLTIGERLAASTKCIGIPFFKIWNGLP